MSKTHFRKVFKSDHLGVADLEEFLEEDVILEFIIKKVKQEWNVKVAGKTGNFNIAYFEEPIKPLVLNVTNSKIIREFNGGSPFVENWGNTKVTLYIDPTVRLGAAITGGVRIRNVEVKDKVKKLFSANQFEKANKAKASIDMIKKQYTITPVIEKKYLEYVAKN